MVLMLPMIRDFLKVGNFSTFSFFVLVPLDFVRFMVTRGGYTVG